MLGYHEQTRILGVNPFKVNEIVPPPAIRRAALCSS
jgi:hypothetical protein